MKWISKILLQLREAEGMSRVELEAISGVSYATIYRYERGLTCNVKNLQALLNSMDHELEVVPLDTAYEVPLKASQLDG